jgi:hypothetical protein
VVEVVGGAWVVWVAGVVVPEHPARRDGEAKTRTRHRLSNSIHNLFACIAPSFYKSKI